MHQIWKKRIKLSVQDDGKETVWNLNYQIPNPMFPLYMN